MMEDKEIRIIISSLDTKVKIFEAKNLVELSLKSIQIDDNFHSYSYEELNKFLYSTAIQGK